ncbi:MAG: glycosyltransferase family 9 protein, partial [Desulfonatronovibrionaceae bacterium]
MSMDLKSIGIWQTAFLGDAVLTLPLVHTLAQNFPEARIHFFVRKGLGPLFAPQPGIVVHEFDKHGQSRGLPGIRKISAQIRSLGPDLWVSAHSSLRSALISRLSRPGMIIGYS